MTKKTTEPIAKDAEPTLTHNGKTYIVSELPEEAQKQLLNVRLAEAELKRLHVQLAITKTAQMAYEQALIAALPEA